MLCLNTYNTKSAYLEKSETIYILEQKGVQRGMLLSGAKVNELNHYVLYKLPELSHSSYIYIYVQHFHRAKQTSI
jgi:hypothetical protein